MRTIACLAALATSASCAPAPSPAPAVAPESAAPAVAPAAAPSPRVAKPAPRDSLTHVLAERASQFRALRVGDGIEVDYVRQWPASVSFDPFRPGACAIACWDDVLFGDHVCSFSCAGRDPSRDLAFVAYQLLRATIARSVPATWYGIDASSEQAGRLETWGPSPYERILAVQLATTGGSSQLSIQIESRVPLTPGDREMLGP